MAKSELELRVLAQVMGWDNDTAQREFRWLTLMSRFKYDGYNDFLAGTRFIGSLLSWIQQFKKADRSAAYALLRERLIYVSAAEMLRLVESFYPDAVEPELVRRVAARQGRKPYEVRMDPAGTKEVEALRSRTLFLGMSEGARLDMVRRANVGLLVNEQIIVTAEPDLSRWRSALGKLKQRSGPDARFSSIYLIDDFVASGTTLLRQENGAWDGKLHRFRKVLRDAENALADAGGLLDPDWALHVHHYIATQPASSLIRAREAEARAALADGWFPTVTFSFGYVLPPSASVAPSDPAVAHLVDTYYNTDIETAHNTAGGGTSTDIRWGYKNCGLTLVLEHNTPNNTLPLIWGSTDGSHGHAMRPLFRRRQRHS